MRGASVILPALLALALAAAGEATAKNATEGAGEEGGAKPSKLQKGESVKVKGEDYLVVDADPNGYKLSEAMKMHAVLKLVDKKVTGAFPSTFSPLPLGPLRLRSHDAHSSFIPSPRRLASLQLKPPRRRKRRPRL